MSDKPAKPKTGSDRGRHRHPVDPERVAAARERALAAEEAVSAGDLLRLLADPTRARVISALAGAGELCVGDIAIALGVSENNASFALARLRAAGIVSRRRAGRVVYYRLRDARAQRVVAAAREGDMEAAG